MPALTAHDPFVLSLIRSLGLSTESLFDCTIRINVDNAVTLTAKYYAAQSEPAREEVRTFQLHRMEAVRDVLSQIAEPSIRAVQLGCGDIVVLRTPERLSPAQIERLASAFQREFPNNRVVVLDSGVEFQLIRGVD